MWYILSKKNSRNHTIQIKINQIHLFLFPFKKRLKVYFNVVYLWKNFWSKIFFYSIHYIHTGATFLLRLTDNYLTAANYFRASGYKYKAICHCWVSGGVSSKLNRYIKSCPLRLLNEIILHKINYTVELIKSTSSSQSRFPNSWINWGDFYFKKSPHTHQAAVLGWCSPPRLRWC